MTTHHTGPGPARMHIRTPRDQPRIEVVERERIIRDHQLVLWPAIPAGALTGGLVALLLHLL